MVANTVASGARPVASGRTIRVGLMEWGVPGSLLEGPVVCD
jgi:hypothetical protein